MARIPDTREAFQRMDFRSQSKVKEKLVRDNFSAMCHAVRPHTLQNFHPVLHPSDMEELQLSKDRKSSSDIAMDLLLRITRSLKKNPNWWTILEKVLLNAGSNDLYRAMNPWERRDSNGGAAGGGGGGGGNDGRGGGGRGRDGGGAFKRDGYYGEMAPTGAGRVSLGGPYRSLEARGPYGLETRLADTTGLHRCLAPLFADGNDTLWREVADNLGLTLGDQMEIIKKAQHSNNFPRLLVDRFIQRFEDAATVGELVQGLVNQGAEGQRVVREMEREGFLLALPRAGSEADGAVGGYPCEDEGEGGTSARFAQAPTPRFPPGNIVADPNTTADHSHLLFGPSPKERRPQEKTVKAKTPEPNQLLDSPPVVREGTKRQEDLGGTETTGMDSIVDNNRQPDKVLTKTVKTYDTEGKILNCPPAKTPASTAVPEDGGDEALKAGQREAAQESMSPQTDSPHPSQSSLAGQEAPEWLRSSQQEIESQLTASSQQTGTEAQQFPFGLAQGQVIIYKVKNMMVAQDLTGNKYIRRPETSGDEVEHELPMPVPEGSPVESGNMEASADSHRSGIGENQEEVQEEILYSYRPDPMDSSAHETILKQVDSTDSAYNEVEGEEHPSALEGQQDISDVIDLRENGVSVTDRVCRFGNNDAMHLMTPEDPQCLSRGRSTGSLPEDTSVAPRQEEAEEAGNSNSNSHSADDSPPSPLPPPLDLVSQQPLSPLPPPQPQQSRPMAVLSRAWDILLGME